MHMVVHLKWLQLMQSSNIGDNIMSLTLINAGTLAVTGGSNKVFTKVDTLKDGSVLFLDLAETDLRLRASLEFKVSRPQVRASAPNGYTQQRCRVRFKQPILLANGEITVNTTSVEVAYDIEASAAQKKLLVDIPVQVQFDSESSTFFSDGVLPT